MRHKDLPIENSRSFRNGKTSNDYFHGPYSEICTDHNRITHLNVPAPSPHHEPAALRHWCARAPHGMVLHAAWISRWRAAILLWAHLQALPSRMDRMYKSIGFKSGLDGGHISFDQNELGWSLYQVWVSCAVCGLVQGPGKDVVVSISLSKPRNHLLFQCSPRKLGCSPSQVGFNEHKGWLASVRPNSTTPSPLLHRRDYLLYTNRPFPPWNLLASSAVVRFKALHDIANRFPAHSDLFCYLPVVIQTCSFNSNDLVAFDFAGHGNAVINVKC